MNPLKEVTIQEINLDPNKKYILSFNFDECLPRDDIDRIMAITRGRICYMCDVPTDNVLPLPFNTTLKDLSIEEAMPIKIALDKLLEEKNKDEE